MTVTSSSLDVARIRSVCRTNTPAYCRAPQKTERGNYPGTGRHANIMKSLCKPALALTFLLLRGPVDLLQALLQSGHLDSREPVGMVSLLSHDQRQLGHSTGNQLEPAPPCYVPFLPH